MGTRHAGKIQSKDFPDGTFKLFPTLNSLPVTVTKNYINAGVMFATASVTSADVAADNGVIHIIDKVIIPPTVDVVGTATANGNFKTLAEALTKANLVATLQGAGPFTVFAPTDDAFAGALTALKITKAELLERSDLADILKYHVLSGKILSKDLKDTQTVNTLLEREVTITKSSMGVKFADAAVSGADVMASNGVIHVIDKVVLPPVAPTPASSGSASMVLASSSCLSLALLLDPLLQRICEA